MPNYSLILLCGILERGCVILCQFNRRKVHLFLQDRKGLRCQKNPVIFNPNAWFLGPS